MCTKLTGRFWTQKEHNPHGFLGQKESDQTQFYEAILLSVYEINGTLFGAERRFLVKTVIFDSDTPRENNRKFSRGSDGLVLRQNLAKYGSRVPFAKR